MCVRTSPASHDSVSCYCVYSNTMELRTVWLLLAMLWAVSARPQQESTEGTPGEAPGPPLPEGINALLIRTSVRLMCAGKEVPDCENLATTCLTEYGLGSDADVDFETACQGKNQLLCYTKISECIDLLSVAPSAGQILVSEVCSGKDATDCIQETVQCMSLLYPGAEGSSACPPTGSPPTGSAPDTACTANVLKCIELLLPEEGTVPATPPTPEITEVVPSSATSETPAEELAALTQTLIVITTCRSSALPNCQAQMKQCLPLFGFGSNSSASSSILDVICKGTVTAECLNTVETCSDIASQVAGSSGDLTEVVCDRLSVPNCLFKTVKCLGISGISGAEPDLSLCADNSTCYAEMRDCVQHFKSAVSALTPEASQGFVPEESQSSVPGVPQNTVPEESQSSVPGVPQNTVPEESQSSVPGVPQNTVPEDSQSSVPGRTENEASNTDPIGFIAGVANNILILQFCAGKEKELTNCHADVVECMFELLIPPPGFGPRLDNETICEAGLDAETCAKKQNCLVLYSPKPNAVDLLPQEICRDRNVSNCEDRAVLCLEISGIADLSRSLIGLPDELPEGPHASPQASAIEPAVSSEATIPDTPTGAGEALLGSSPSSGLDAIPEGFDITTCLEVLSPRPILRKESTTITKEPGSPSPSRGPLSTTTNPPVSTTTRRPGSSSPSRGPLSTTTNPPVSTTTRRPGSSSPSRGPLSTTTTPPASTTTRQPGSSSPSRGPLSTTTNPPASTTREEPGSPSPLRDPATPTPTRGSAQFIFSGVVEEEEDTPAAEILCPKGGLECIRKAEACLERLKPDEFFIRQLFSCNAEVGRRRKNCMRPAMESLLKKVDDRRLQTTMIEAFPICFEEHDFEGIRLCEARTCMEVETP
ncbi:mucin-5AC-like isoform X2 [Penaeus chinensis]|uniref:mucin-5AC-like isoform X2 n=1 Tax=Penaeus chinensis TaxID=139456 RepID=UPI001FB71445|nr:mucin-5AC-like isoform X2 [Penaeus chinensis]